MQSNHDIRLSYFGFIENRDDAVKLLQACLQRTLPFLQRRPTSSERSSLALSGHVFIYEEKASGIQRWTDGRYGTRVESWVNFSSMESDQLHHINHTLQRLETNHYWQKMVWKTGTNYFMGP
jgi:hypothetical protein